MRGDEHWSRWDVRGVARRLQNMLVRGTVAKVDDDKKLQELELALEDSHEPTEVENFSHNYGVSFHPHPDAEVLCAALGGNRDHLTVLGIVDRRHRMKGLAAGEVAYHDDQQQYLHFKRGSTDLRTPKTVNVESTDDNVIVKSGGIVHINP